MSMNDSFRFLLGYRWLWHAPMLVVSSAESSTLEGRWNQDIDGNDCSNIESIVTNETLSSMPIPPVINDSHNIILARDLCSPQVVATTLANQLANFAVGVVNILLVKQASAHAASFEREQELLILEIHKLHAPPTFRQKWLSWIP